MVGRDPSRVIHAMLDKRAQGRPPRGAYAVGPQKIVEGMQDALRNLQTNNVTRKDIARFAGVTPALVTYYFPERDTLIEAATVPIIDGLARLIQERLTQNVEPRFKLMQIVIDILSCFFKDIVIVDLYVSHHRSFNDENLPGGVQEVSRSVAAFFDEWLSCLPKCDYDGRFLTNAVLGICRSLAYHHYVDRISDTDPYDGRSLHIGYAEMICHIMVDGLSGSTVRKAYRMDLSQDPHGDKPGLKTSTSILSSIKMSVPPGSA